MFDIQKVKISTEYLLEFIWRFSISLCTVPFLVKINSIVLIFTKITINLTEIDLYSTIGNL